MTKIEVEYFIGSLAHGVIHYFVWHPERIWGIAAIFGLLAIAVRLLKIRYPRVFWLPVLVACFVWVVFGFLERECVIHQANIRIDIFFIWPFIFGGTALLVGGSMLNIINAIVNDEDRIWLTTTKHRDLTGKKTDAHILHALDVPQGHKDK